jgi:chitinase
MAYYASWAANRSCNAIRPSDLDPHLYSHLIFAFASISTNYTIVPSQESDESLFTEFNELKEANPSLKTLIAVGGWAFNDPPTQHVFSEMVATQESRSTFIDSVVDFLQKYGFDGIDIDWEYPVASDRGGSPEDFDNFVKLLKEMREAVNLSDHIITVAVPLGFNYLRHFDLQNIHPVVDFLNMMAYDLHGAWDANISGLGPFVRSHTNITEIEDSLNMFFKSGVPPTKLVLGMAAYGRSFTLSNLTCTSPGCPFSGPGNEGPCTKDKGTLALFEIVDLLQKNPDAIKIVDEASASCYAYFGDQWVSFDDNTTFAKKMDFAQNNCLGGTMIWSADLLVTEEFSNECAADGEKKMDSKIKSILSEVRMLKDSGLPEIK